MSTPILATKLFVPLPRPKVVSRPQLLARLNQGLARKLTLISAPAGFGKTTLVSDWLSALAEDRERPIAWLSLDEGDNDLPRFLVYLVAALQTVIANIGEGVLAALRAPQPPPTEAILTTLLNEITSIPHKFILVLDDYHLIETPEIDRALAFLLEHLPPVMHLVIVTREDPPLPLARYRVRGQLTEVRASDLRLTASEAAEFLNQVMGLSLSAQEIAALEGHTEGWIAGLQLAALSMQGHQDIPGFIRAFAGDHHYIVDYLVEEVLARQPTVVRSFLLQTAILERLSGPLCDAVTGHVGGNGQLEALERGNFFVVPLDDKRHWYRYHHLFADVLRAHLTTEQPALVPLLHQRASVWYEHHGTLADAIHHALAAKDFARVADLIEPAIPALGRSREGTKTLGWLKALPDDLVRRRPVLCVGYAWALMAGGELEAMEPWLRAAEQWLAATAGVPTRPAEMIIVDEVEFSRLPARIAIYRAGRAQLWENVPDTLHFARQALELIPEDDHLGHGAATALLGLASWTNGELEVAYRTYADGMARVRQAGNLSDVISSTLALADIRISQGRLRDAISTYEDALHFATTPGEPILQGTADLYVGMSELHREQNKLDAAMQYLLEGEALSKRTGLPQNRYRWFIALARLKEAQGDLEGALALLREAARLYVRDFFPNLHPVAALQARIWIRQGRLNEALGWAHEQKVSIENDLSYLREFDHITLARLLLARVPRDHPTRFHLDAQGFLERLLQAAQAGGRIGSVIEISLLQAIAHQSQGNLPAALAPLQRALTLAEPEGYIRIFVDEGPPMRQLLEHVAQHGIAPTYLPRLLAAFDPDAVSTPVAPRLPTHPTPSLIEPLSERELDVLRLFATELSGPEIADHLVIALSTVRTHTKGIYSKLNVNSRREAVKRAEELHLI